MKKNMKGISLIGNKFSIGKKRQKFVIPRTSTEQKLILRKVHLTRIDDNGVEVGFENLEISIRVGKWDLLERYSGKLLTGDVNTTSFNHNFDSEDEIRVDVEEIVSSGVLITDAVSIELLIDYL